MNWTVQEIFRVSATTNSSTGRFWMIWIHDIMISIMLRMCGIIYILLCTTGKCMGLYMKTDNFNLWKFSAYSVHFFRPIRQHYAQVHELLVQNFLDFNSLIFIESRICVGSALIILYNEANNTHMFVFDLSNQQVTTHFDVNISYETSIFDSFNTNLLHN